MLSDSEYDGDLDIAADEYGLWEDFYLSSEEVYTDYV
jgi:hypothetical protein